MFTFILKHSLFAYALFCFSQKCLTVHFTYQGCSTAFVQVVNECVCMCVCEIITELATGLIFSMLLSLTRLCMFYCDDPTLPNCLFSRVFFVCCFCIFFSFLSALISWFFVWLLTMSWLDASKSYTNWTIKENLNGEKLLVHLFCRVKLNKQANTEMRNLFSDMASCWASRKKGFEQSHNKGQIIVFLLLSTYT